MKGKACSVSSLLSFIPAHSSVSVLENQTADPRTASLIKPNKIITALKFILLFDQPTHAPKQKEKTVICAQISAAAHNVGDLLSLVSSVIKNVGVILSFDKNKISSDG